MLAAGGTGGHLFPAQALAEELVGRGYRIHLMTDERVRDYGKSFPAEKVHIVPSATLSLSDPLRLPGRLLRLASGYRLSRRLIRESGAVAVAGFGGYPSLPPLMAAARMGVPCLVHEQNSVLGRANRLLASRVTAVATSFDEVRLVPDAARANQRDALPVAQQAQNLADFSFTVVKIVLAANGATVVKRVVHAHELNCSGEWRKGKIGWQVCDRER